MKKGLLFCLLLLTGLAINGQASIFFEDFESGTLSESWTARPNLKGTDGLIQVTTTAARNGDYGLRIGKSKDGELTTNALDLKVSLEGHTQVAMSFWIFALREETHVDDGIYFSDNNGATFEKVFSFKPDTWCYLYGQFPTFDVDQLALAHGLELNDQFVIRFQQRGSSDFNASLNRPETQDGYYLDDINIFASSEYYAPLPFRDDFESTRLDSAWAWNFADDTALPLMDVSTPENIVDVVNNVGRNNSFGVIMGKRCDGGLATNALDLKLNLEGETQVALSFWIFALRDEANAQDGLYFSDDGGNEFVKVFEFSSLPWCYQYGQFPVFDVDELAAANGLQLTGSFVIRFQQHGMNDFSASLNRPETQDGFYIDEVNVYRPGIKYAPLPFFDDFESARLDSPWAWNFADETALPLFDTSTPENSVGIAQNIGLGNSFAAFMGKRCDGGLATNALDLHLDLKNQSQVALTFWIFALREETQAQDGLYFSDNGGGSFTKVLDFLPDQWCYQYGQYPPVDVDQLAAEHGLELTDRFVIRFQQHGENDFSASLNRPETQDGFYIDNVHVYAPELLYASIPFSEDFESGTLGTAWAWNFADDTAIPLTDVTSPENVVEVLNGIGVENSFGVRLGKRCDGGFATNALDLHLDAEGYTELNMNFFMRDLRDETQAQDGLYFSDDGGATFTKVYDFDFSNLPFAFAAYSIDIDSLAMEYQLSLTNRFVIRFQQHGDSDFSASLNRPETQDGMLLDNINITGMTTTTTDRQSPIRKLKISPNPAGNEVRIFWEESHLAFDLVEIFAPSGQRVETISSESNVYGSSLFIDISGWASGLYFIRARTRSQTFVGSFLKSL